MLPSQDKVLLQLPNNCAAGWQGCTNSGGADAIACLLALCLLLLLCSSMEASDGVIKHHKAKTGNCEYMNRSDKCCCCRAYM